MKLSTFVFSSLTALLLCGCSSNQSTKRDLIEIDVSKKYPEKEINLEGIADITYVKMREDNDDYLFKGTTYSITKNRIVFYNYSNGDFLFFSKDGEPVSMFNKRGGGPDEYNRISNAVYDEVRDELFASDLDANKIHVYSSAGVHKRTLDLPDKTHVISLYEYGDNSLIFKDLGFKSRMASLKEMDKSDVIEGVNKNVDEYTSYFIKISKTDGSLEECIDTPYDFDVDLTCEVDLGGQKARATFHQESIVPHSEGLLLVNQELDTLYLYDKQGKLSPVMSFTPSVKKMDPISYTNAFIETSKYLFFDIVTLKPTGFNIPKDYVMRDKSDGAIYTQKIVLDDYEGKTLNLHSGVIGATRDCKVGCLRLGADKLREANEDNKLSGKLKELVDSFDEEDENDVYILLNFK